MPDSEEIEGQWASATFRGDRVLARCDPTGAWVVGANGLVDFQYRAGGKVYRTHADKLKKASGAAAAKPRARSGGSKAKGPKPKATHKVQRYGSERPPDETIQLWTDGACTGNPGPAGLGVVWIHAGEEQRLSEYLGRATNNIAELKAMLRALEMVEDGSRPVDLLSDSDYGLKVVAGIYRAKKNVELIEAIQQEMARFSDLRLVKVPGHAGVDGNELADALARQAISTRANSRS